MATLDLVLAHSSAYDQRGVAIVWPCVPKIVRRFVESKEHVGYRATLQATALLGTDAPAE
ncbi:MAG: hypothetical protein HEQ38_04490 [Gemmatimonas sp.]|nr:hypothetical protein [Gemmatimonas sp.]